MTVVMRQYGLGLQDTFDWIGELHQDLEACFLAEFRNLPHFPEESDSVNREVREYANALGNWVRANDQWSFEVRIVLLRPRFAFNVLQSAKELIRTRALATLVQMDLVYSTRDFSLSYLNGNRRDRRSCCAA